MKKHASASQNTGHCGTVHNVTSLFAFLYSLALRIFFEISIHCGTVVCMAYTPVFRDVKEGAY